MRRLPVIAAMTTLFFWLLACSGLGDLQGHPPPDLTWVGVWEGPGLHLIIHPDGMVDIDRRGGSGNTKFSGPAQVFEPTTLTVGLGPISSTLNIAQPPTAQDGRWVMIADGITLVRTADVPPPAATGFEDLPSGNMRQPPFLAPEGGAPPIPPGP
jgi:hypothetical protein